MAIIRPITILIFNIANTVNIIYIIAISLLHCISSNTIKPLFLKYYGTGRHENDKFCDY